MSRHLGLGTAVLLLLLLPASAGAAAKGLRVRATGPAWEGGAVSLAIEPEAHPTAAGMTVIVSSGDRWLAELTLPAAGGVATFSTGGLASGRPEIRVSSGSAEGSATVRVLPRRFGPAAAAGLLLTLLVAARLAVRSTAPPTRS